MTRPRWLAYCALLTIAFITPAARARVSLPSIFSDHMVLQRDLAVPIWGSASGGAMVTVKFADQVRIVSADKEGKWRVELDAMPANAEPRELSVTSGGQSVTVRDVLVGEVWLCAGQSNMAWNVAMSHEAERHIKAAERPTLRLGHVSGRFAEQPQDDVPFAWSRCSPETVGTFSAVAYFFGVDLQRDLDVPVGVINMSWGGSPAEAWTDPASFSDDPMLRPILARQAELERTYPEQLAKWQKARDAYEAERRAAGLPLTFVDDPGDTGAAKDYADPKFNDAGWTDIAVPGGWEGWLNEKLDGVVWFRKRVALPPSLRGRELQLSLGVIDDTDVAYVNGREVGRTLDTMRRRDRRLYAVPAEATQDSELLVAVRVYDNDNIGGFTSAGSALWIGPHVARGENERMSLAGIWKCHVEHRLPEGKRTFFDGPSAPPREPQSHRSPGYLYNGMVLPIAPYGLRGVLWYQGESNTSRARQYETLLPVLIRAWRSAFGRADLPFGIVQLPNNGAAAKEPTDVAWSHLREAQRQVAEADRNSGLIITLDLGEADDLHPIYKQPVGARAARWALHDVYRRSAVAGGPRYASHRVEGETVIVSFRNAGEGLRARGGDALSEFTLAGGDHVWHRAEARIIAPDTVAVRCDAVPQPAAVRYAWKNNPERANLVNNEDLPASPFRSDDWPGPTDKNF